MTEQQKPVRVVNINNTSSEFSSRTRCIEDGEGGFIPYWRVRMVLRPDIFSNPFTLRDPEDRDERALVYAQFAEYWYAPEQKFIRARALMAFPPGSVLGCVCKPKECHADIVAGYINWKRNGPTDDSWVEGWKIND
jgi:Domain of unknown function (DUF4326)